jgi:hypothetical protein
MSGFFGRVSRFARPALAVPRENQLTEVFAAVLARVDALALGLADHWLAPHPSDDVEARARRAALRTELLTDGVKLRGVRTQRPTRSGGFVDIELRFADAAAMDDLVVWVEVKHGASPHDQQLDNYLQDLAATGARAGALILLAPRQSYPFEPEPAPDVAQRTWQDTAAQLRRWRDAPAEQVSSYASLARI